MAAPLGTTAFKIPNLAEKGYEIQQAEAKQERERKDEESIAATGQEAQQYKLDGDAANGASMLFNEFRKASVDFEQTGSESARQKMNDYNAQLQTYVGAILTQNNAASLSLANAEADGFQNYTVSPEEARQGYSNFMNRKMEFTMKDGTLMVKDGEGLFPHFNHLPYVNG